MSLRDGRGNPAPTLALLVGAFNCPPDWPRPIGGETPPLRSRVVVGAFEKTPQSYAVTLTAGNCAAAGARTKSSQPR